MNHSAMENVLKDDSGSSQKKTKRERLFALAVVSLTAFLCSLFVVSIGMVF